MNAGIPVMIITYFFVIIIDFIMTYIISLHNYVVIKVVMIMSKKL